MENKDIDKLIAEKVMGWERIEGEKAISEFENQPQKNDWFHRKCIWIKDGQRMACEECGTLPQYTDSISDAWQVVEKMIEKGFDFGIDYDEGWIADFGLPPDYKQGGQADENTAPLAICKAALKSCEL